MQYVTLAVAYLYVLLFLIPKNNTSGSAIYKGELDDSHLKPMRYCIYFVFYLLAHVGGVLKYGTAPVLELLFQTTFALSVEGWIYLRRLQQTRIGGQAQTGEHATENGQAVILTPEELEAAERERLAEIIRSGDLDDILKLCSQNLPVTQGSRSFSIPRWLTRDEYNALHSMMKEKQWRVHYTAFGQYTGRPRLVISRFNPRSQMQEPGQQQTNN